LNFYLCNIIKNQPLRIESYLLSRLVSRKNTGFSRPVVHIAVVSVALGLACMILSLAILTGFRHQIRDKVSGMVAHIQLNRYDNNLSWEQQPVSLDYQLIDKIKKVKGVTHAYPYITKPGIIRTAGDIEGVVLKGIDTDYDWSFLETRIISGKSLRTRDSITLMSALVSQQTASRLGLKVGDPLRMYFIREGETTPAARRLSVSGIYETGLEEFDRMFVFCEIGLIRRLNGWEADQTGGIEVKISDFSKLDGIAQAIYREMPYDLNVQTVTAMYPQLFDWLRLMDMNVLIILVLMTLVSAMTMISTLLILVLERTTMIGVLKSLGATDSSVRKLFLMLGAHVLLRGLLAGNLLGLGLAWLQWKFEWLRLDQASYYMTVVPVKIQLLPLLLLNVGAMLICILLMWLPSRSVAGISPVKTLRYS